MSNTSLVALLERDNYKKVFFDLLSDNAPEFIQTIITVANSNEKFKDCDPLSILSAAKLAATLKLPISPSLGMAYIVPFGNVAQFQIGWKGLKELAHRTKEYVRMNSGVVYEGQIKEIDFITGEIVRGEKISDKVIGYVAYFRLVNGFEKTLYMSKEEMEEHALKYSQTYKSDKQKKWSTWAKEFDKMACKTVFKTLLSNWGPLKSLLAQAIVSDQAAITKNSINYIDNSGSIVPRENYDMLDDVETQTVDAETGEILTAE